MEIPLPENSGDPLFSGSDALHLNIPRASPPTDLGNRIESTIRDFPPYERYIFNRLIPAHLLACREEPVEESTSVAQVQRSRATTTSLSVPPMLPVPPVQEQPCNEATELSYAARESLKQEVSDLLESAGAEDWDGEGAFPLSPETATTAQRLIDAFPTYARIPDVAATPHGEVDFDWVIDKDLMLTISVVPAGQIAFAGLLGDARLNGQEAWTGVLPPCVQFCLDQFHRRQGQREGGIKA